MNRMVKVNNKQMEIFQKGTKGMTILVLSGMGCSFEEWFEVTEALSETNQIIMFHRPGLGESEIGEENRTTLAAVNETIQLLQVLDIKEPIFLIGHSYGGLCAQHLTKLYPDRVKGLLLIDSTSDSLERLDELDLPVLNESSSDDVWIEQCRNYASLQEMDLRNIIRPVLSKAQKRLPESLQERLIEFQQKPDLYKAMKSEVENWKSDAKNIKELGRFADTLLCVVGRDKEVAIQQGIEDGLPAAELTLLENTWEQLITEQAELSENSSLVFAQQATHLVYLDRPDLVIALVKSLLKEIKK